MQRVYLLCFVDPETGAKAKLAHAEHYIGWSEQHKRRLDHHRRGSGAKLPAAVVKAGYDFVVARTWEGADKNFERRLKNRKNSRELCPICRGDATLIRGKESWYKRLKPGKRRFYESVSNKSPSS